MIRRAPSPCPNDGVASRRLKRSWHTSPRRNELTRRWPSPVHQTAAAHRQNRPCAGEVLQPFVFIPLENLIYTFCNILFIQVKGSSHAPSTIPERSRRHRSNLVFGRRYHETLHGNAIPPAPLEF